MAGKVLASAFVLAAFALFAYVSNDGEVRRANQVSRNPPAVKRAPAVTDKQGDRPFPNLVYKIPQKAKADEPLRNPPIPATRVAGKEPAYTDEAHRARIEGFVLLELLIERDGRVSAARVLKPLPFGLDQAAADAVKRWRFKPGTLNGQPVDVIFNLTVTFKLN